MKVPFQTCVHDSSDILTTQATSWRLNGSRCCWLICVSFHFAAFPHAGYWRHLTFTEQTPALCLSLTALFSVDASQSNTSGHINLPHLGIESRFLAVKWACSIRGGNYIEVTYRSGSWHLGPELATGTRAASYCWINNLHHSIFQPVCRHYHQSWLAFTAWNPQD